MLKQRNEIKGLIKVFIARIEVYPYLTLTGTTLRKLYGEQSTSPT